MWHNPELDQEVPPSAMSGRGVKLGQGWGARSPTTDALGATVVGSSPGSCRFLFTSV